MEYLRISRSSLVTKLIMINLLVLLAVGGVVVVNLVLSRQVGDTLNTIIDRDVSRVIDNAELSRNLNQAFAETHLLLNTFTEQEDFLTTEGGRLVAVVQDSMTARKADDTIQNALMRFRQALEDLLGQCAHILRISHDIQTREHELDTAITALDRLVTNLMIARKVEGKDYELFSLEEVSASIPDYRSLLLQIAMQLEKARHNYLGTTVAEDTYEQQILALFADLNSGLLTVTTAGDELAGPGQKIITAVQHYQEQIAEFHQAMRIFQSQFNDLNSTQIQVMAEMKIIDTEITQATWHIRETVAEKIYSSGNVTALLSMFVIAVLGGGGIYVVRVTRPILHLTESAAEIAAGNLDTPIDSSGSDEIGRLARSFAHMRGAIQQKIIALHAEIEERKRIEQALRESEEHFRSIFSQSPIGIELYDRHGSLFDANAECLRMFGLKNIDAVKDFKLFEDPNVPEDTRQRLRDGELVRYEAVFDFDLVRAHNLYETTKSGQCMLECFLTPWGIGSDENTGFLVHVTDITERKRAEKLLADTNALLHAVFEQSPVPMALVHIPEMTLQMMNPATKILLGLDDEEVHIGQPLRNLRRTWKTFWPDGTTAGIAELPLSLALQGIETRNVELRVERQDGTMRLGVMDGVPIYNAEGEHIAGFVVFTDMTERKQAEEQIRALNAELEQRVVQRTAELEAVNKELRSFAYVVSHDLKAPLRGISRLAAWLVEDYAEAFDEKGREMIELLIGRMRRLDDMIEGILQYSRVGRLFNADVSIDLNRLVSEVIDLLAVPDHIHVSIPNPLPVIVGDRIRIAQIFQNLIGNSVKFMDKPQGEISIDCHDDGTHWIFRVSDNGPGIATKYHEKVFQIFQTLTPRDQLESTGIGLALVKKIVELYGGTIGVESTVGEGTTFFFTLPYSQPRHHLPQKVSYDIDSSAT